jgi:hypothetical protein
MPVDTFIDHGPNVEHLPPGVRTIRRLPGGAPDILYPKYLQAIKGSKHIVAKPGQVIQIGSMTDTIVPATGVVLSKPLPARDRPIRSAIPPKARRRAMWAARRMPARSRQC